MEIYYVIGFLIILILLLVSAFTLSKHYGRHFKITEMDEMEGVDQVRIGDVDSVYILYDTSTYDLSCQMKSKLMKRLEDRK